jgi:Leucine-rich repeat (LRR) protein
VENSPIYNNLVLNNNQITDKGLIELSQSGKFPNLQQLGLSNNQITDKGLIELSQSGNFPNLKGLYLDNNKITQHCVNHINPNTT